MKKRPVLVTGATGFVGSNVARYLLEKGETLRLLTRESSDRRNLPSHSDVEVFLGDLRDLKSVKAAVKGVQEIYHVAADYRFWARNPQELYDSNVQGTENLLRAAADSGIEKFVHTSTVGTIGLSAQPNPCDETTSHHAKQFTSHYKRSKWKAEQTALEFAKRGLPVVIVNPSAPIGPWDRKPTPTGKIIVDFMRGKMPAYVDTGMNFVHVRDVAEGHWLAAQKGRIGERYILGGTNLSMFDFLQKIGKLTNRSAPRFRIPYSLAWLVGFASTEVGSRVSGREPGVPLEAVKMSKRYMFFDSSKAQRELGFRGTAVELAILDAVLWFSQNGYFRFELKNLSTKEAFHGSPI